MYRRYDIATLDSLSHLDPLGLVYIPVRRGLLVLTDYVSRDTWRFGAMTFHVPTGFDSLQAHQPSLRLLRSEVVSWRGSPTNNAGEPLVLEEDCLPVSSWIHARVFERINLEQYLSQGLGIVSRLPDVSVLSTTQFLPKSYAHKLAQEAFRAIINLGSIYCGQGVHEVLSVVSGKPEGVDSSLEAAMQSHFGRDIAVRLADVCKKVAAEYDAMAAILSLDEAAGYLFTRFTGKGRIVELAKLLLRTGSLLHEDERNIWVVKRGLESSMRSFSFLWTEAVAEARRLIDTAKEMMDNDDIHEIDFWDTVDRMSSMITQPRIPLDSVVAVALAELGVVVNCQEEEVRSVLRAIAGDGARVTTKAVDVTNPGSVWVAPFRALTKRRIVMALDGHTVLQMVDDVSGVRGRLGLFEKCISTGHDFLCCEAEPYAQIDDIKATMPKAFAALARDDEPWNDGLERNLLYLSSVKVPPDGLEVDAAVKTARESYVQKNVLANKYVEVIFSVRRIVSVFTLAKEQGRRMGDVLYQYSLFMVHPDVSKVRSRRLRDVWNTPEALPVGLRRFIENVRLTYEGWMVYPETGSAGVPCVRRRYTNRYVVWLGFVGPGARTSLRSESAAEETAEGSAQSQRRKAALNATN